MSNNIVVIEFESLIFQPQCRSLSFQFEILTPFKNGTHLNSFDITQNYYPFIKIFQRIFYQGLNLLKFNHGFLYSSSKKIVIQIN